MNTTELLELERKGWEALATGRGPEFYGRTLTHDAIVVVPSMMLDRAQTPASRQSLPPWSEYHLEHERVLPLGEASALVTYEATARRPGDERAFRGQLTSGYRAAEGADGAWRLAFHRQTPLP